MPHGLLHLPQGNAVPGVVAQGDGDEAARMINILCLHHGWSASDARLNPVNPAGGGARLGTGRPDKRMRLHGSGRTARRGAGRLGEASKGCRIRRKLRGCGGAGRRAAMESSMARAEAEDAFRRSTRWSEARQRKHRPAALFLKRSSRFLSLWGTGSCPANGPMPADRLRRS
jgi:hypothetical protein